MGATLSSGGWENAHRYDLVCSHNAPKQMTGVRGDSILRAFEHAPVAGYFVSAGHGIAGNPEQAKGAAVASRISCD